MYQQPEPPSGGRPARRTGWPRVNANIWAIGATSLLTDISSEMITSILPLYVVLHLQMTPLAFGAVDGLYQGVAAAVRMASGFIADRQRRHKAVAVVGYGLSTVAKLAYLAAGTVWPAFLAVVSADRLGKGIRTAPRDALIAASARPGETATAFGLHRMMDAAGATLGPLVAFAVLAAVPGGFDRVFVVSFAAAVVGLAALVLFVRDAGGRASAESAPRLDRLRLTAALSGRSFRAVLIAAAAVSLASISDGLIYLLLQRQAGFDPARLTLLFVATPLVYFLLAGPLGVVADRVGPRRLFLAGHGALLAVYALLWLGTTPAMIGLVPVLLGAYYAATDGILAAMASTALPTEVRATGLGLLATCTTGGRGVAAVAFGALWTYQDSAVALVVSMVALGAGMVMATRALRTTGRGIGLVAQA